MILFFQQKNGYLAIIREAPNVSPQAFIAEEEEYLENVSSNFYNGSKNEQESSPSIANSPLNNNLNYGRIINFSEF